MPEIKRELDEVVSEHIFGEEIIYEMEKFTLDRIRMEIKRMDEAV